MLYAFHELAYQSALPFRVGAQLADIAGQAGGDVDRGFIDEFHGCLPSG